ncbi:hypothetical protein [Streptomyces sp. NPDC058418]|uniref:hypothetical protein n=1 Tax=Streptomyces sp. NPDC058418 TaxID=3346488 RepID=UPI00365C2F1F
MTPDTPPVGTVAVFCSPRSAAVPAPSAVSRAAPCASRSVVSRISPPAATTPQLSASAVPVVP